MDPKTLTMENIGEYMKSREGLERVERNRLDCEGERLMRLPRPMRMLLSINADLATI